MKMIHAIENDIRDYCMPMNYRVNETKLFKRLTCSSGTLF